MKAGNDDWRCIITIQESNRCKFSRKTLRKIFHFQYLIFKIWYQYNILIFQLLPYFIVLSYFMLQTHSSILYTICIQYLMPQIFPLTRYLFEIIYSKSISVFNCSAWLRLHLNIKIWLHSHHHQPPATSHHPTPPTRISEAAITQLLGSVQVLYKKVFPNSGPPPLSKQNKHFLQTLPDP